LSYVFVSYFREDAKIVRALLDQFDRDGVPYWIDESGIELGEQWRARIAKTIEQAGAFLLCISSSYWSRPNSYVHEELGIAVSYAAKLDPSLQWILPFVIDESGIPSVNIGKDRRLSDLHAIRLKHDRKRAFGDCARVAKQIVQSPGFNRARIELRSESLEKNPFISVDGRLLCRDGSWLSVADYKREFDKWFNALQVEVFEQERKRPFEDILTVLEPNSRLEFSVVPGSIELKMSALNRERVDRYGVGGWYDNDSNLLQLRVAARERVSFLVRETPRSGFLWRNRPVPNYYYLTRS
jgi:hypothetical protein